MGVIFLFIFPSWDGMTLHFSLAFGRENFVGTGTSVLDFMGPGIPVLVSGLREI
jgi:hypothetical protein